MFSPILDEYVNCSRRHYIIAFRPINPGGKQQVIQPIAHRRGNLKNPIQTANRAVVSSTCAKCTQ